MTSPGVAVFLAEITASLNRLFSSYSIDFLLKTSKSLKANIHIKEGLSLLSNTMPETKELILR